MDRRRLIAAAAGGALGGVAAGVAASSAASAAGSGGVADGAAAGGGAAAVANAPGTHTAVTDAAVLANATAVLRRLRFVSLSHLNDPATTNVFPGDPAFILDTIATIPNDGYYLRFVHEGEHTGTHWGAPGHFNEGEPLADQLDPGDFFLPAVKIDVRDKCRDNADYAVTIDDITTWERRHGRIPNESAVVIWTGWERFWGTPAFPNQDADGVLHQPGFAIPTVEWLIETGRLGYRGATGTDTFSPDVGIDENYTVSKLVYQRHRLSFEILANLAHLPTTGAWIMAGGQINQAGSGATANVMAVIPPGVRA